MKVITARESKGYPIYTKRIMEVSDIYVADGEILKSRNIKPELVDIKSEAFFFNNIAIEDQGIVTIYCRKDRHGSYKRAIEWLESVYGEGFEKRFKIHCK